MEVSSEMPSKQSKHNSSSPSANRLGSQCHGQSQPGKRSAPNKPPGGDSNPNRRSILKTAVAGVTAGVASKLKQAAADEPRRLFQLGDKGNKPDRNLTPLKQRAMDDYRRSFAHFGGRLSSPIRELFLTAKDEHRIHFGVVVIGSGYGASIAATKLSQNCDRVSEFACSSVARNGSRERSTTNCQNCSPILGL